MTDLSKFTYKNTEVKHQHGGKLVRKVSIEGGKGYKSVTHYTGGKKVRTVKKRITKSHISEIQRGKFIPGLFSDCNCKTRKARK